MRFLDAGLGDLVSGLPREKRINIREWIGDDDIGFDLLTRKGVYPYSYMNSFERFEENKLPDKILFFNKLRSEDISGEDYEHAQKVWTHFKCKNMQDYTSLYLRSDVILLSDVFKSFREKTMDQDGLDPVHYYSLPGLSWDAMLKQTKVKLTLFPPDQSTMALLFENGIRGGVSTITHRHAKANNKYMRFCDENREISFIIYLDANNLYGWAMMEPLPTRAFKWMTPDDLNEWREISSKEGEGCYLEVDLDYLVELHNEHRDLSLAPQSIDGKRVPHLGNRRNYLVHHRAQKCYLKFGMKLLKIYQGIKFSESRWMKPYIEKNTERRSIATNGFTKDVYKLRNNSVFGKTSENIRDRTNIVPVCGKEELLKWTKKAHFKDRTIIEDDGLVLCQLRRLRMLQNKPR